MVTADRRILRKPLFILVSVLPQLLLAFMGGDFPQFAFSSAGHFKSPCLKIKKAAKAASKLFWIV
jgi:hypothetical protein